MPLFPDATPTPLRKGGVRGRGEEPKQPGGETVERVKVFPHRGEQVGTLPRGSRRKNPIELGRPGPRTGRGDKEGRRAPTRSVRVGKGPARTPFPSPGEAQGTGAGGSGSRGGTPVRLPGPTEGVPPTTDGGDDGGSDPSGCPIKICPTSLTPPLPDRPPSSLPRPSQ